MGADYADHAREVGGDPDREPPFFFVKPGDGESIIAVRPDSVAQLPYPTKTQALHYEVELVAAIGEDGTDVSVAQARGLIFGYAVGLDMTRRDLQNVMKQNGRP